MYEIENWEINKNRGSIMFPNEITQKCNKVYDIIVKYSAINDEEN